MITGLPGETEADFNELCQFVEAAQFDRLGVFSYSDEETSASYQLDGKVDARTIYNRKRRLMALQRKISRRLMRRWVGQEVPVLIAGPSAESEKMAVGTSRLPCSGAVALGRRQLGRRP